MALGLSWLKTSRLTNSSTLIDSVSGKEEVARLWSSRRRFIPGNRDYRSLGTGTFSVAIATSPPPNWCKRRSYRGAVSEWGLGRPSGHLRCKARPTTATTSCIRILELEPAANQVSRVFQSRTP